MKITTPRLPSEGTKRTLEAILADVDKQPAEGQIKTVDPIEHPVDPVVAGFVGAANFLPAEVIGRDGDGVRVRLLDGTGAHMLTVPGTASSGHVVVCARPEALALAPDGVLAGRVSRASYLGNRIEYVVQVGELAVRVEGRADDVAGPGDAVRLAVRRAVLYPNAASAVTSSGDRTT